MQEGITQFCNNYIDNVVKFQSSTCTISVKHKFDLSPNTGEDLIGDACNSVVTYKLSYVDAYTTFLKPTKSKPSLVTSELLGVPFICAPLPCVFNISIQSSWNIVVPVPYVAAHNGHYPTMFTNI